MPQVTHQLDSLGQVWCLAQMAGMEERAAMVARQGRQRAAIRWGFIWMMVLAFGSTMVLGPI